MRATTAFHKGGAQERSASDIQQENMDFTWGAERSRRIELIRLRTDNSAKAMSEQAGGEHKAMGRGKAKARASKAYTPAAGSSSFPAQRTTKNLWESKAMTQIRARAEGERGDQRE